MALWSETRVPSFGFIAADPNARLDPNVMIRGSFNLFFRGEAELETVAGFKLTAYGGGAPNNGGDVSQLLGDGWATIGDDLGEGSGNILTFIGKTLWFTGSGEITVWQPGVTATPVGLGNQASNNFLAQVCPLNNTKNGYLSPFLVGLEPQALPAVLTAGAAGVMNGKHSVQLTWVRDATRAESNPSTPALSVTLTNQKLIIQFPASTNPVFDRDRWRVYATEGGFGDTGPFLLFTEVPERRVSDESGAGYAVEDIGGGVFTRFRRNLVVTGYFTSEMVGKRLRFFDATPTLLHTATITSVTVNTFVVNGVTYGDAVIFTPAHSGTLTNTTHNWNIDAFVSPATRAIEFEYLKNDLLAIQPPTDFFPPATKAKFIGALGNVIVLVGTEDGNGIAVSVPNFPEAFPPKFRFNLPEPPVGVLSRPQDGFFYVLCENSIHEMRYAGFTTDEVVSSATDAPLVLREVSDLIGVSNQRAACQFGKSIYFFTKSKSPARILPNGVVDNKFGDRVQLDMRTWDAKKVVVTYDEQTNYVMYSHLHQMFMYYPSFDFWTPPTITDELSVDSPEGDFVSGFTMGGLIHASFFDVEINNTVDTTVSSTTITGAFSQKNTGKKISILGAGPSGGTLNATIISVAINLLSAVISVAASTAVTNASATISGFSMYSWDRDINNVDIDQGTHFRVQFAFSDYGMGTRPKTVYRARVGAKLQVGTIHHFDFYRDYNSITTMGAQRDFTAIGAMGGVEENHIQPIVDCNNGEAQVLSVRFDGTGNRAKIHYIEVSGEASGIDANYNI